MNIKDIYQDKSLTDQFLSECIIRLYDNTSDSEKIENRKIRTGYGVNKYDFERLVSTYIFIEPNADRIPTVFVDYWIHRGHIYKYHRQIADIIYKYEYLMETKGI